MSPIASVWAAIEISVAYTLSWLPHPVGRKEDASAFHMASRSLPQCKSLRIQVRVSRLNLVVQAPDGTKLHPVNDGEKRITLVKTMRP